MRFKEYITEKFNVPIDTDEDIANFNTKLDKKAIMFARDVIKQKVNAVPIAGGTGNNEGKIKLRITGLNDDEQEAITNEIKAKHPELKFQLGNGNFGTKTKGINWTTESMETAQCIGVFIDGNQLLDEIGEASTDVAKLETVSAKYVKELVAILGNGEDWDSGGARQLKTILESGMTLDRWVEIGSLIAGMSNFVNDLVTFKPHIIHGSINDYYAAEEENQQVVGQKANTADMIVCSVTATELIDLMKTEKAEFDKKGVCTIGRAQFLQASLKKEKGGAQLGKITSNVKDKYNISDYSTILHNVIGEGFVEYQINEGKLMDAIKGFAGKLVKGITNIIKSIGKLASNFFRGLSRKYNNQVKKDFALIKGLRESTITESRLNVELQNLNDRDIKNIEKTIDSRVKTLIQTGNKYSHIHCNITKRRINTSAMQKDHKIKLFANMTTLLILDEMIKAAAGSASKLSSDLVEMRKEMFFGKTQLPVYKVYGGTGNTYEYLGSGKEYMEKNTAFEEDTVLMGIRMDLPDRGTDKYYVIYSAFVLGVDEDGNPKYAENRMGTNRQGAFSYVIEGTKEMNLSEFQKYYA